MVGRERERLFNYKKRRTTATIVFQRWARRFLVQNRKWYIKRDNDAARNIQRIFRGRSSRKHALKRRRNIIKVQSYARGFVTRKHGTTKQIAEKQFRVDNAAIMIQKHVRMWQAKQNFVSIRKDQFEKDVALYLAATKGNLNEIVRIFDIGGRINGYLDNNDLDALAIAKEKGFILVCDWLSEEEVEERRRIFREWLESDERKQLDLKKAKKESHMVRCQIQL